MVITNDVLYKYYFTERDLLNNIYNDCNTFIGNQTIIDKRNKDNLYDFKKIIKNTFSHFDEMCQYLSINNLYLPVDINTSIQYSKNASIDNIQKHNIIDLLEKSEFYINEYVRDKENHILTPLEEFFVGVNELLKDILKVKENENT